MPQLYHKVGSDRGIVTPDRTDLMGNVMDDFVTYNEAAGTLARY